MAVRRRLSAVMVSRGSLSQLSRYLSAHSAREQNKKDDGDIILFYIDRFGLAYAIAFNSANTSSAH